MIYFHTILFYMDITCHAISSGMWNVTELLTVLELWPYEVGGPSYVM
jgi:hypothetical protein